MKVIFDHRVYLHSNNRFLSLYSAGSTQISTQIHIISLMEFYTVKKKTSEQITEQIASRTWSSHLHQHHSRRNHQWNPLLTALSSILQLQQSSKFKQSVAKSFCNLFYLVTTKKDPRENLFVVRTRWRDSKTITVNHHTATQALVYYSQSYMILLTDQWTFF